MDIDDLEDRYPRIRRLLAAYRAGLIELDSQSTVRSLGKNSAAVLRTKQQLLVIRLDSLEAALQGFKDTGTWSDYFPEDSD